jgi:thioredoxin-like negative regulator of GroEL
MVGATTVNAFDMPDSGGKRPNREELLQMAIHAAKNGNRDSAVMMLSQVLAQDRRNERAMLWMARLAKTNSERRQWLERVLDVNPDNETARDTLKKMDYRRSARENRTLLIFGVVVGVLLVLLIVVVLILALLS